MDFTYYFALLRRRWLLLVALPLVVVALNLAVALARPPEYGLTIRILVNRGLAAPNSTAGLTSANADTVAQDLPAIIGGSAFARDVAQELARRGEPIDSSIVNGALSGGTELRVVNVDVRAPTPEAATAIAQTAVDLIKTNGLRYWGDPTATTELPGIAVGQLDLTNEPIRIGGLRSELPELVVRAVLAFLTACGIVIALDEFAKRRRASAP